MIAEGVLADFNAWSTPDIKESCALIALSALIIVENTSLNYLSLSYLDISLPVISKTLE
jgi:hypothetical protein